MLNVIIKSRTVIRIADKQTRARQNQKQKQRGVVYNFLIDWLTNNQHRINGWVDIQTTRSIYT